jgi:hypothetical protein
MALTPDGRPICGSCGTAPPIWYHGGLPFEPPVRTWTGDEYETVCRAAGWRGRWGTEKTSWSCSSS